MVTADEEVLISLGNTGVPCITDTPPVGLVPSVASLGRRVSREGPSAADGKPVGPLLASNKTVPGGALAKVLKFALNLDPAAEAFTLTAPFYQLSIWPCFSRLGLFFGMLLQVGWDPARAGVNRTAFLGS